MRCLLLLSIVCSIVLSGCGFQLRGLNTQLSKKFEKTYVSSKAENDDVLYSNVKQLITLNGGRLTEQNVATIGVHLSPVKIESRQIAISGNGSTKEYERTYTVTVTILDEKNGVQLGSRIVSTIMNMQLNDSQVLAGEEQTESTNTEAQRSLAQSVLLYLEAF